MVGLHRTLLLTLAVGSSALSSAITFSNFTINGSPVGATRVSLLGNDGISFSIPEHFLLGVGSATLTVGYRVDATPGNLLTSFDCGPVGNSKLGSVAIDTAHTNGSPEVSNYLVIGGPALITLPNQTFGLSGTKSFYDVLSVIQLNGNEAASINKVTVYTATYREAVPEPVSMLSMGIGLAALAMKRRMRKS